MKKNFCKVLAMAIVAIMMMSVSVFAAINEPSVKDEVATVTLTGLTVGEEATILVVNAGTDLATLTNNNIIYIDQMTVVADPADAKNGIATFTLDASATAEVEGVKAVDIYYGYTSMTGAATGLSNVTISGATVMYGDVNDDAAVNNKDKTFLARYIAGGWDVTLNMTAADVNIDGAVNNKDKTFLARFIAGGWYDSLPVQ